ncbi:class I SAM-dependent methyltransferase [Aestuariispira insulae]|uniref:Methyltransferase family protein n=1 Tax=Aestuariispira insulae TaxID=1461337 RepID=A0A3D9HXV4_9PROT|nr:methyltransferase domain-containing protein [Aestuariispira insulae]RED54337.1 methyltransferase family protein [Aestuariispira insulae]
MKKILGKMASKLKTERSEMVVEGGSIGVRKKLMAWWRGADLVVRSGEDRARKVKIRKPVGKEPPPGGKGGTAKQGQSAKASGGPSAKVKGSGGAAPRPDPNLPKARRLTPKELGEAEEGLKDDKSPIQNLDDGALMTHLWGAASRTPGGINGAIEILEPIIQGMDPHKKVLDVFAGDGRLNKFLETYHQADCTGYEVSQNLVDKSSGKVRHFDPNRANFGEEQYDYVCAAEGMQDIEEKQKVLQAIANSMKVGGKMVLVDALTQSSEGHAPYMARLDGFLAPVLSARFYKKILEECGLKVIGTKNITRDYQTRITNGWGKATKLFQDRSMDSASKKFLNEQATHHFDRLKSLQEQEAKMIRLEIMK